MTKNELQIHTAHYRKVLQIEKKTTKVWTLLLLLKFAMKLLKSSPCIVLMLWADIILHGLCVFVVCFPNAEHSS